MKSVVTGVLLAALSNAASANPYQVTWTLVGFSAGGVSFPVLQLDIGETERYLSAHGGILMADGQLSPATGTCTRAGSGDFFNLQIDRNSYYLKLDSKLNGKISGRDAAGNVLPEVAMTLQKLQ